MAFDLSIIIPIYNVEKYVGKTMESIVRQGDELLKCEVIIVNDGTPDNSMSIVTDYVDKIPNLKIINQSNRGLSCARNAGLEIACGDYVWFVDSDDSISENALESIYTAISNYHAQIIGFAVKRIDELTGEPTIEPCIVKKMYQKILGKSYTGMYLHRKTHNGMVQRYIIERNFLLKNKLYFFPGIYFEDTDLLVKAKCLATDVVISNDIIYNYLVRSGGNIMSSFKRKHLEDVETIIRRNINFKKEHRSIKGVSYILNCSIFEDSFWILNQNDQTIDCFSNFMIEHKDELIKIALYHGLMSFFPITPMKFRQRIDLLKKCMFKK